MAWVGSVDQLNEKNVMESIKKKELPYTGFALSYTECKGPFVPFEKVQDCQEIVLNYHKNCVANEKSKHYISDIEKRIEEEEQIAIHYLVEHAGYPDFMFVGAVLPLIIEYTISIINGKNVDIGEMLSKRIQGDVEDYKVTRSDVIKTIKYN